MYQSLEPRILSQVTGKSSNGNVAITGDFFTTSTFVYTLLFVAIVAGAFYRYALAGIWRMGASEKYVKKSNEEFRRVTLGLLGVFSMFIIIYTINPDLLAGDVGWGYLKTKGGAFVRGGSGGTGGGVQSSGTGNATCTPAATTITNLQSGNVCAGATCKALQGCNYQKYLPILRQEASNNGVSLKMMIVIMCKESSALPGQEHVNSDGSRDCGLMQINQRGACSPELMDPATNIARGAQELKSKQGAQIFGNVPTAASVFAAYNCCTKENANSPSQDCTPASGFPGNIPKWACPINPGPTDTNMCFVKNYACEATACLSDPSLSGL